MLAAKPSISVPKQHLSVANTACGKRRLVTHNTVEERMLAVSRKKLVLERVVVQTGADASLRQARRPACSVLWEKSKDSGEREQVAGSAEYGNLSNH